MRASQYYIHTLKEDPNDACLISHKLMIRSGMIQPITSGIYAWMPLGLKILHKVAHIIRQEMNAIGALEIMMPCIQPAELWKETHRWEKFGPQMLKMKDRHERQYCFGPTNEEVVTDIARQYVKSYKQLPLFFYQIQTKFRDEIRPRFGVLRSREFMMKDGYSFHTNMQCLKKTYSKVYSAYERILQHLQLDYCIVTADTGSIGGSLSHEFHVVTDSGEDSLAISPDMSYTANLELATCLENKIRPTPQKPLTTIHSLSLPAHCIKKICVRDINHNLVCLLLKKKHDLNIIKIKKIPGLEIYTECPIEEQKKIDIMSLPPGTRLIVDRSVSFLHDFSCPAPQHQYYYTGINFDRDLPEPIIADIRNVVEGDLSPNNSGPLAIRRGIEIGHIFILGDSYAKNMSCCYADVSGNNNPTVMGCYGIGISRIIAACIEQNNDQNGILWPTAIAPFQIIIICLDINNADILSVAENLYHTLIEQNIDVLLDDRDTRAGSKFYDADLLGIPHRITISKRTLTEGRIEYRSRKKQEMQYIEKNEILSYIIKKLHEHP